MRIAQVSENLSQLNADSNVMCQVVDEDGKAWNMHFEFIAVPNSKLVQLKVSHPDLKKLPPINFGGGTTYP